MQSTINSPKDNIVHFKGSSKREEIFINKEHHIICIGGIISDLMALPPEFDLKIDAVLVLLDSIAEGKLPMEEIKRLPEQMADLETSAVLRDILLWQPLGRSGMSEEIEHEKNLPTLRELKYYDDTNIGKQEHPQIVKLRNENSLKWHFLSDLIMGKGSIDTKEQLEEYRKCISLYNRELEALVFDIRRIRTHLSEFLEGSKNEKKGAKNTIYRAGSQIEIVLDPQFDNLFKKNQQKKYSQVFIANSIYGLVALEINLMSELSRMFSRCKLCGRYFVPYTSSSIYCKNPNPKYDNRPCSEIGPNHFYQKSRKEDPLKKEFDKNCKAYEKWCNDNKRVCAETLRSDKETLEQIRKEIDSTFELWRQTAKQAIEAFAREELSREEVWKIIQKPEKHQRSQRLYKSKKDWCY